MFNSQQLLNSLLSAGQSIAEKGIEFTEKKLDLPTEPAQRGEALNNMGKGALAAGALALLLGTKTGRNISGGALKVGSLAALGGLAYKAYQNWQSQTTDEEKQTLPEHALEHSFKPSNYDHNIHSTKILQAIIAAAKADGHIDQKERSSIQQFISKLDESSELGQFIEHELEKPLNPEEIAQNIDSPGLAAEVYLMSRIIINESNMMEKRYLDNLAKALKLENSLVEHLNLQATKSP